MDLKDLQIRYSYQKYLDFLMEEAEYCEYPEQLGFILREMLKRKLGD